jgi:hypothetical protein
MQYYDITIAANGRQLVEAPGTFLYYLTGNAGGADNTIKVTLGMGGTSVLLKPGQSIRLPANAMPIDTWRIENYANAQIILGQVLVGMGEFHDSNVTGTVQVVDGGKSRTLGGAAFVAAPTAGNVAAQNSAVQLWNPAASGKRLVIEQVSVSSGNVASQFNIGFSVAALPSLGSNVYSKLAGGAVGAGVTNYQQAAGIPAMSPFATEFLAAAGTSVFKFSEPVVLPPGNGCTVVSLQQNNTVACIFEWYEETNQ